MFIMSECTHDCSTCGENCNHRTIEKLKLNDKSSIKKIIGVVSGKGGVGKSLVTSLLAVESNRQGYKPCILDGDITGPSIPKVFGVKEAVYGSDDGLLIPVTTKTGIDIMSTNLILENEEDPVIWRGSMLSNVLQQFYKDVLWIDEDVMYIDMPPGTGDVPLTVYQMIPIDGIVIVTSPQDLVTMIVSKAVNMARLMNVPILGIVENYSYLKCPDCGKEIKVFGESNIEEIAKKFNIKNVVKLPLDPLVASKCDEGKIEFVDTSLVSGLVEDIMND